MNTMKKSKLPIFVCTALVVILTISSMVTYSRQPPGTLPVFVIMGSSPTVFMVGGDSPQKFYSLPHAAMLHKAGQPIARTTLAEVRKYGLTMAEESKEDFLCFHAPVIWWLIDNGLWRDDCRWNQKGEWQSSEWLR